MLLTWLKQAVKAALHEATEEWALECGLPRAAVERLRATRLANAAAEEGRADARAAFSLGVDDDDDNPPPAVLPMPSAARVTLPAGEDPCPAPGDDDALLDWASRRRAAGDGWADVARLAAAAGHAVGEDALRMRLRRRDKGGATDEGDNTRPA